MLTHDLLPVTEPLILKDRSESSERFSRVIAAIPSFPYIPRFPATPSPETQNKTGYEGFLALSDTYRLRERNPRLDLSSGPTACLVNGLLWRNALCKVGIPSSTPVSLETSKSGIAVRFSDLSEIIFEITPELRLLRRFVPSDAMAKRDIFSKEELLGGSGEQIKAFIPFLKPGDKVSFSALEGACLQAGIVIRNSVAQEIGFELPLFIDTEKTPLYRLPRRNKPFTYLAFIAFPDGVMAELHFYDLNNGLQTTLSPQFGLVNSELLGPKGLPLDVWSHMKTVSMGKEGQFAVPLHYYDGYLGS